MAIAARTSLRFAAAADTHTDSGGGSGQKVHQATVHVMAAEGRPLTKESKLKCFMLFKLLHQSYRY